MKDRGTENDTAVRATDHAGKKRREPLERTLGRGALNVTGPLFDIEALFVFLVAVHVRPEVLHEREQVDDTDNGETNPPVAL